MEHRVRPARLDDVPGIERVYRRAWMAAYEPFVEPERLAALAALRVQAFDWSASLRAPRAAVFVAGDHRSEVLGVVQADEVLPRPRDLPEVTMLYVDPEAWGSPVAADLLGVATDWIAGRGHGAARLRVAEAHRRARRFYEREGWHVDPDLDPVRTELAELISYRRSLTQD